MASTKERIRGLRNRIEASVNEAWYGKARWSRSLLPLSLVYRQLARVNQNRQSVDFYRPDLPVVVVGNIVAGGAGKTPLVLALCELLQANGWRPAVLSRGYGADCNRFPHMVNPKDSAGWVGDEPALMARRLRIPVCIDPQRARGARFLRAQRLCDVIVCDDGLQHYALARDIEIAVVDGQRLLGNRLCLPAGPLREPAERLDSVDFVVLNGKPAATDLHYDSVMHLRPQAFVQLKTGRELELGVFREELSGQIATAVTGIGNPQRFFSSLYDLGLGIKEHPLPDHHDFRPQDLLPLANGPVIMTEKDAVKCVDFATDECWYLKIAAELDKQLTEALLARVRQLAEQFVES